MNPQIRKTLDYIIERLDMQEGDWPGVEVFVNDEGRSIWGLLPEDLYSAIVQLHVLITEEEEGEEYDGSEE